MTYGSYIWYEFVYIIEGEKYEWAEKKKKENKIHVNERKGLVKNVIIFGLVKNSFK